MSKIFVVTGSNKGIGYAIVKNLSGKVKDAIIYLTARNPSLGQEALAKIKSTSNGDQKSEIRFHQLNITSDESCKKFAEFLKTTHGGLDVLINNAGITGGSPSSGTPIDKQADECMSVNYYGTKRITEALLPLIRPGGRIVILCSLMGIMDGSGYHKKMGIGGYAEKHVQRFYSDKYTLKDVDDFVAEFIRLSHEEIKSGQPLVKQGGYIPFAYVVSKAADIAYTKVLARLVKDKNIKVYGCCPGYVATDLNSHSGPLTIDQGSDTPIFLATSDGLKNGEFYSEREVVPWPITNYDINKVIGV